MISKKQIVNSLQIWFDSQHLNEAQVMNPVTHCTGNTTVSVWMNSKNASEFDFEGDTFEFSVEDSLRGLWENHPFKRFKKVRLVGVQAGNFATILKLRVVIEDIPDAERIHME